MILAAAAQPSHHAYWSAQSFNLSTISNLQPLDQVFNIHQPARAVFQVEHSAGYQMTYLPFTHGAHGGCIERLTAIHKRIAQLGDLFPQTGIPSNGTQFYQRLPLIGPGGPSGVK